MNVKFCLSVLLMAFTNNFIVCDLTVSVILLLFFLFEESLKKALVYD